MTDIQPKKLNMREAMKAHGPQSYLINRLSRYGLLGWLLAGFFMVSYIVTAVIFIMLPDKVVVVDENGKIIGNIQYSVGLSREMPDFSGPAKRFTQYFLSHNSATVLEDKYLALSMMSEPLRNRWRKTWFEQNVVSEIEKLAVHCDVLIDDKLTSIKEVKDDVYHVNHTGKIVCGDESRNEIPFNIDFSLASTQITAKNTSGIEVINLFNDPFKHVKTFTDK